MDRREFLKRITAGTLGLFLPVELSTTLTITDIKLLDGFVKLMKFGGVKNGMLNVEIDTASLWEYVRLVDSDGREWHTDDQGRSWHCGMMSFTLFEEDEQD